jgi:hypothetical protein
MTSFKEGESMKELVPFALGCLLGVGLARLPVKARFVLLPVACVLAGAVASFVNGELASALWPAFVSIDALLVWAGAALASASLVALQRRGRLTDRPAGE